jgi:hypothetical protein
MRSQLTVPAASRTRPWFACWKGDAGMSGRGARLRGCDCTAIRALDRDLSLPVVRPLSRKSGRPRWSQSRGESPHSPRSKRPCGARIHAGCPIHRARHVQTDKRRSRFHARVRFTAPRAVKGTNARVPGRANKQPYQIPAHEAMSIPRGKRAWCWHGCTGRSLNEAPARRGLYYLPVSSAMT